MDFAVPAYHRIKLKESETIDKYLDLARELKNGVDTNCNWCVRYRHERIGTGTGGLENKRTRPFKLLHY